MMRGRGLRRSLLDFKKHPWLHFVSILTITASLLLLGMFFISYRNLEHLADKTKSQNTGTVYLKDSLNDISIARLREYIFSLPGVRDVQFKTKRSVLEDIQAFLGSSTENSIEASEIFPDVLEVEVKKEALASEVTDLKLMISKLPEVSEVDFSDDWLVQFKKLRQMLNLLGLILSVGIIIGCGFIIANFMGLRHQSRRSEIEIVRLHGAHPNFILAPFLWEGLIEGVLGSITALVGLLFIKTAFSSFITFQWASLIGIRDFLFLSPVQTLLICLIGVAMAFFGSFTVFLRFQERH